MDKVTRVILYTLLISEALSINVLGVEMGIAFLITLVIIITFEVREVIDAATIKPVRRRRKRK